MKIYIDLLLFQNTFVTFLILIISYKILNIKIRIVRGLIISFISSLISVVVMIFLPNLFDSFCFKIFILFLMVRFGIIMKENFLRRCAIFFIVTLIFGGIGALVNANFLDMMFCFIFATFVIFKLIKIKKEVLILDVATCYITFEYGFKKYRFKALVDTGNRVKTFLDEDVIFVKNNLINIDGGEYGRVRNVSYQTVAGKCSNKGIRVNNIFIEYGSKKMKNDAVIVSTPNISKNFDAIVSLNFVEGGWQDGNLSFDETKSKKVVS